MSFARQCTLRDFLLELAGLTPLLMKLKAAAHATVRGPSPPVASCCCSCSAPPVPSGASLPPSLPASLPLSPSLAVCSRKPGFGVSRHLEAVTSCTTMVMPWPCTTCRMTRKHRHLSGKLSKSLLTSGRTSRSTESSKLFRPCQSRKCQNKHAPALESLVASQGAAQDVRLLADPGC